MIAVGCLEIWRRSDLHQLDRLRNPEHLNFQFNLEFPIQYFIKHHSSCPNDEKWFDQNNDSFGSLCGPNTRQVIWPFRHLNITWDGFLKRNSLLVSTLHPVWMLTKGEKRFSSIMICLFIHFIHNDVHMNVGVCIFCYTIRKHRI